MHEFLCRDTKVRYSKTGIFVLMVMNWSSISKKKKFFYMGILAEFRHHAFILRLVRGSPAFRSKVMCDKTLFSGRINSRIDYI